MVFETERLLLQPWQGPDWRDLSRISGDTEVMRYINGGVPWTDEETREFVDRQVQLYAERGFCRWRLIERTTGEFIGFCGVGMWRSEADPEIGWWLARSRWSRGYATEAARAALDDALERVQLPRIVSVAMCGNAASIRIMQKLGLQFECEFESLGFRLVRYAIHRDRQGAT